MPKTCCCFRVTALSIMMCQTIWILFASVCVVVAEWNTKDHMKREHSLTKPYIGNKLPKKVFCQPIDSTPISLKIEVDEIDTVYEIHVVKCLNPRHSDEIHCLKIEIHSR